MCFTYWNERFIFFFFFSLLFMKLIIVENIVMRKTVEDTNKQKKIVMCEISLFYKCLADDISIVQQILCWRSNSFYIRGE